MEFRDKNYDEVYVGAEVDIPSPNSEDNWNFEFTATVVKLDKVNGYVIVEDGDGDCWTVEVERVELT
jgi:hypothetical protein